MCVGVQGKVLQGEVKQGPKEDIVKGLSWATAHPQQPGCGRHVGVTLNKHHKYVLGHLWRAADSG